LVPLILELAYLEHIFLSMWCCISLAHMICPRGPVFWIPRADVLTRHTTGPCLVCSQDTSCVLSAHVFHPPFSLMFFVRSPTWCWWGGGSAVPTRQCYWGKRGAEGMLQCWWGGGRVSVAVKDDRGGGCAIALLGWLRHHRSVRAVAGMG
jgi:hypothetical protein